MTDKPNDPAKADSLLRRIFLKGMKKSEQQPEPKGQGPPDPSGGKSGLGPE